MTRISLTDHPAQVGESYLQHLGVATGFGARMIVGGLACLVHGLLPFLCTTSGSRTISSLHERIVTSRRRRTTGVGASASTADLDQLTNGLRSQ